MSCSNHRRIAILMACILSLAGCVILLAGSSRAENAVQTFDASNKLYEQGKPNATLFRIIDRNVRVPRRVLGDIRSQLAACEIAARGMTDLVTRYGVDGVVTLMQATMDYSERLTRHCLAELPDGESICELIPIMRPCESSSGPPELPGLIDASV